MKHFFPLRRLLKREFDFFLYFGIALLAIISLPLGHLQTSLVKEAVASPFMMSSEGETQQTLMEFPNAALPGWMRYTYGPVEIEPDGTGAWHCRMSGGTYERCGVRTQGRDIESGIGVSEFSGFRVTVKNLSNREVDFAPFVALSWFSNLDHFALLHASPIILSSSIPSGKLPPLAVQDISLPFDRVSFPSGMRFDAEHDFLAGVAIGGAARGGDIGVQQIALYGEDGSQITRQQVPHTGGYFILQKQNGAQYRIDRIDYGGTFGQPFRGLGYLIEPGDTIFVRGVLNMGLNIKASGREGAPIRIIGDTEDAALDGKGARLLALNGGLLYLDGDYFIVEDLELRNCGLQYGGAENAAGIKTQSKKSIFKDLTVKTCGMGFLGSPLDEDLLIEDSEFFNNGYFGSGYTHNIYNQGKNSIFRNNAFHHAGGQNFKDRGCGTEVLYNLIRHAGNFEMDNAGSAHRPAGCTFRMIGNLIEQFPYAENRGQVLTFFEDQNGASSTPATLVLVNNTFIGANIGSAWIRVGENKIAYAYNNALIDLPQILYQRGTPDSRQNGILEGSHNFISAGASSLGRFVQSFFGNDEKLERQGWNMIPLSDSPLRDAGLSSQEDLPLFELNWPEMLNVRSADGLIDIGAFEYTASVPACIEQWVCSEWGACSNGTSSRSCRDVNNCGTEYERPTETQTCTPSCEEQELVIVNSVDDMSLIQQARLVEKYPQLIYNRQDNPISENPVFERTRYNLFFDLDRIRSMIPENARVSTATLALNFYHQYNDAPVEFFTLLEPWKPSETSWNSRDGSTSWQVPGGTVQRDPVLRTVIENKEGKYRITKDFDLTPVMQLWLDGASSYGIQIRAPAAQVEDLFGANYFLNGEYLGPTLTLSYSTCR